MEMNFITAVLLTVTLTFVACDLDLDFRCTGTNGHYVIINPDTSIYTGVQAYHENGTECDASVEGVDGQTFVVPKCGHHNVQVVLTTSNRSSITSTISCESGTRSQQGYTLPLSILLTSTEVLRPGSAHYFCHDTGVIFIRNPREEVYFDSVAYSNAGDQLACHTKHTHDNKLIEVSGCDTTSGVLLKLRKGSTEELIISHQSDIFFLDCGETSAPVDTGRSNGATYKCYKDGSIVFNNPRSELYKFSWAEQGGNECTSVYVENYNQIFITSCDYKRFIILVVRKTPVTEALILHNANVFMLQCR